jgi:phage-related protein
MKLATIRQGRAFAVRAIDLSDDPHTVDCPALDFIGSLSKDSQKSMVAVLVLHAEHGPILNEQKSRELEDGIYEFKNRQGARILYFYEPNKVTILTHGFQKGSNIRTEIARAKRLRDSWRASRSR